MPAEQNFRLLKKCYFNAETELMKTLLFIGVKPFLNIKVGFSQRSEVASARVSLRGTVLKHTAIVNSVQYCNIKFIFGFTDLFCPDEVAERG